MASTKPADSEETFASPRFGRVGVWMAIAVIRAYQGLIRPLLMGTCKFCPSCSEYAVEALRTHGLIRGGGLGLRRLIRCHPFSPGGLDPVPSPPGTCPRSE